MRKEKEDRIIRIKCQIIWSREWVDLEDGNTQPTQEEAVPSSEFLLLCYVQEGLYLYTVLTNVDPKPHKREGEI